MLTKIINLHNYPVIINALMHMMHYTANEVEELWVLYIMVCCHICQVRQDADQSSSCTQPLNMSHFEKTRTQIGALEDKDKQLDAEIATLSSQ